MQIYVNAVDTAARLMGLGAVGISTVTLLIVVWDRKPAKRRDEYDDFKEKSSD